MLLDLTATFPFIGNSYGNELEPGFSKPYPVTDILDSKDNQVQKER